VSLRIATAGSPSSFLAAAGVQYSLMRPDLNVSVTLATSADSSVRSSQIAWNLLASGAVDVCLVPFAPSAAQLTAAPDFVYLPL
jgi:hypothetical protein